MAGNEILISTGNLTRSTLAGQVAIVTGAGRGIGFETARSLAWLGAQVVLAEVDRHTGKEAEVSILREMGSGSATFIHTDVGDESSLEHLKRQVLHEHTKVDIVINNATVTPMGAVKDVSIKDWDTSYRVNLRGPVLLAQAFLPGMMARNYGVFVCVSSVAQAYMGAYEIFKSSQVELAKTLDAELEGTSVISFTIGPGIVLTPGLFAQLEKLSVLYKKTPEEFIEMAKVQLISAEGAGAGFAAAIAYAPQFRGMEINSRHGLVAAGINLPEEAQPEVEVHASEADFAQAQALFPEVRLTFVQQVDGWKERSIFQRQWMYRDFKNYAGLSVDQMLEMLDRLAERLEAGDGTVISALKDPAERLVKYYGHYQELARGYEKNPQKREEQMQMIEGWKKPAERLAALAKG